MPTKFLLVMATLLACSAPMFCQQNGAPAPVQPGAPGKPSTTLNAVTAAPPAKPPSEADIRFMQDMIMHHGQAVEMTELAKTRAQDPAVKDMASKIDLSQGDEIRWMKQWLNERGVAVEQMGGVDHAGMAGMDHAMAWITPAWQVWITRAWQAWITPLRSHLPIRWT